MAGIRGLDLNKSEVAMEGVVTISPERQL
jgi:hypothetical protein